MRVDDEEDHLLKEHAKAEGLTTSDFLRKAVAVYLGLNDNQSGLVTRLIGRKRTADCLHPPSKRRSLSNGIQCDDCGTWL
jgi:hypothetical protein